MRAVTLPMDTDDEGVTPPSPTADALQRLLMPTNRILLQVAGFDRTYLYHCDHPVMPCSPLTARDNSLAAVLSTDCP